MSLNVKDVLQAPILYFDSIDSTNNYAAGMIDADTAHNGLTIIAKQQSAGKGQRGKIWEDEFGASLLMSIVIIPKTRIDQQFSFSAAVVVAIAEAIESFDPEIMVRIKFPNDIIINDKKAAGILIENVLRGNLWTHATVGLGLNIFQTSFPPSLPNAISLRMASQYNWDLSLLMQKIRSNIFEVTNGFSFGKSVVAYNERLYKVGQKNFFLQGDKMFEARICGVSTEGKLMLRLEDGLIKHFAHGELEWSW